MEYKIWSECHLDSDMEPFVDDVEMIIHGSLQKAMNESIIIGIIGMTLIIGIRWVYQVIFE